MSSILDTLVSFDSNILILAIRSDPEHPDAEFLLLERVALLTLYVPLQVTVEVHRNLDSPAIHRLHDILSAARAIDWGFQRADADQISYWESKAAKKGDAVIASQIETAGVEVLVTDNRHFLGQIPDLPFRVLTAAEALRELG